MQKPIEPIKPVDIEVTRYSKLSNGYKALFLTLCSIGLLLSIYYLFFGGTGGIVIVDLTYYYFFIGIFGAGVYLIIPARKRDTKLPWYDLLLGALMLGICLYFARYGWSIASFGWKNIPLGVVLLLLILECGRRTGGWIYLAVIVLVGAYPLYARQMPGILWGMSSTPSQLIEMHIFKYEGLLGLPCKVASEIIVGFLVFAAVLIASGAGEFFMGLAMGLLGRFRGGPAKVSVVASAFFGSLSGSAVSNVAGTGCVTIPTMKSVGFPPHYAGAVEACASTGGVLMPPVMGAVAFVMCQLVGVPYTVVMLAAIIPSLLYYFGLLMQVDFHAGKAGLKGLPREQIPPLKKSMAQGWPFLAVLLFLVWGMVFKNWTYTAPWLAVVLMIVLSFYRKETRMTPKRLVHTLAIASRLIVQLTGMILPIGFIVSALATTGVATAFTSGLVDVGGGNIWIILFLGVIACYIMGMAGLLTPAYIFLAVTLAPAVKQVADLNVIATHLFIIYWAMLSAFTPPVAAASFLGAAMAGAPPMKTGMTAMRLGIVIYFIPFFFIFHPALVLQGPLVEALYRTVVAMIGIVFIAGACEGYLPTLERIPWWARATMGAGGFLIAYGEWGAAAAGVPMVVCSYVVLWLRKRAAEGRVPVPGG